MAVASVGDDGQPSVRMVLLKEWGEQGFVFHSNYDSRKGRELTGHPRAALLFYWEPLGRQVRIEGPVEHTSAEESDAYFATRPRGAQIGAHGRRRARWSPAGTRLDGRVRALDAEYSGRPVPRPARWGGLRVRPHTYEFWQNRPTGSTTDSGTRRRPRAGPSTGSSPDGGQPDPRSGARTRSVPHPTRSRTEPTSIDPEPTSEGPTAHRPGRSMFWAWQIMRPWSRDRDRPTARRTRPRDVPAEVFRARQFELGLAWVSFPEGYGGLDLPPGLQREVDRRLGEAGARPPGAREFFGLTMAGPTVVTHGSDQLRRRLLCSTFTGEVSWCQLFSEPGSGSDLAGLSTRAVPRRRRVGHHRAEGVDTLAHIAPPGHVGGPDRPRSARAQGTHLLRPGHARRGGGGAAAAPDDR